MRATAHLAEFVTKSRWEDCPAEALDIARRAILVESQAKRNASTPPPSQPGQGPSVRTGRLRSSITWRLGEDAKGVYADVGTNVHYAPYVELGTSRMRARPFLRPALAAARR